MLLSFLGKAASPVLRCTRHLRPALFLVQTREFETSLTPAILAHLDLMKKRYVEVEGEMTVLSEAGDHTKIARLGKEFSELSKAIEMYNERNSLLKNVQDLKAMQEDNNKLEADKDKEMEEMIAAEMGDIEEQLRGNEDKLMRQLVPRDSADDRGVVLEVRAGTGGDEASLFAGEIFKMYEKFSGRMGWNWELLSLSKTDIGGFKEASASISGELVFKMLKFESGVHRVQRIPVNDTKIQTSAASVVVLPEAEDIDIQLRPQDIKVDVMRSQGAGGQSVNKTESAVRMTHIPTGLKVEMQDERSQIQNRSKALKILRSRVFDFERRKKEAERSELRSKAQGTGDRSDKIRTYNFPQDRVTDHRVSVSISGVSRIMNGEDAVRGLMEELMAAEEKDRIDEFLKELKAVK